jgi:hypothetical protein
LSPNFVIDLFLFLFSILFWYLFYFILFFLIGRSLNRNRLTLLNLLPSTHLCVYRNWKMIGASFLARSVCHRSTNRDKPSLCWHVSSGRTCSPTSDSTSTHCTTSAWCASNSGWLFTPSSFWARCDLIWRRLVKCVCWMRPRRSGFCRQLSWRVIFEPRTCTNSKYVSWN